MAMAFRRKKFRPRRSVNSFERRLQANLHKLSCNTIPGIQQVNLFKSDGTVIHFISPKVDAVVSANIFIVSGNYTHNKIEELLPDILPQIGSDHLTQLKDYAEKFEALKPSDDDDEYDLLVTAINDEDVPMLIDEHLDFERVAQECKYDKKNNADNDNEKQSKETNTVALEPLSENEMNNTNTSSTSNGISTNNVLMDQDSQYWQQSCSNVRCRKIRIRLWERRRAKFKKCSGCKNMYYCCRKCQKYHWNTNHRYMCVRYTI
eukprot:243262_1